MSGTNVGDALGDMWRSVLLFVPTALAFVAILLIGYLLARLIRTVVERSLKRVGFDRAIERSGFGRALDGSPVTPGDLCAKIAFYGVLLFALQLAFGLWGPNAVSDLLTLVIAWLPRAFVAIVIVVVAVAIAGAARDLITAAFGGLAYGVLLAKVTSAFIIGLGLIAALEQVGIATAVTGPLLIAVLATIAGVIIVGVGGGLVRPMQRRWEAWLDRAGAESHVIREHARTFTRHRAAGAAARDAAASAGPGTVDPDRVEPGEFVTGDLTGDFVPGLADREPVVPRPVVLESPDENGPVTYVSAMAASGASESERTQVIPVQPIVADPDHTRDVSLAADSARTGDVSLAADLDRTRDVPLIADADTDSDRTRDVSSAAGAGRPAVPSQEQTQVIRPPKSGNPEQPRTDRGPVAGS